MTLPTAVTVNAPLRFNLMWLVDLGKGVANTTRTLSENARLGARGTPIALSEPAQGWTFLSNHAHVRVCLAQRPGIRLREVAFRIGITERAVQRIVAELEEAGYITRMKDGRTNRYTIHRDQPLRHAIEMHHTVGDLLESVAD